MKIRIIPTVKAKYYFQQFDALNSIEPMKLKTGEYFLDDSIIEHIEQQWINNISIPKFVRDGAMGLVSDLKSFELRDVTDDDLFDNIDPFAPVELFPYPDRPIRVFIEHKQVTAMIETPYKPLIDFALLCPYIKDDSGITLWLKEFANDQFTAEEVQGVLQMFNAEITVK
jgi:hypothetical protein